MGWINDTTATLWSLGHRVRAMAATRQNELTTSEALDGWIRQGGPSSMAGPAVTVASAQGLAAVAASVRVLSNNVAQLPLGVMRRQGEAREPARDLPLYRLLHDRPNQWQTSYQFRKLMMRDLLYRGNAYALKVPGSRGVQSLIRLHPDRTSVAQDPRTMAVSYTYTRPDGQQVTYAREQILHVWADSDDGIAGLNPIKVYRESIGDGLAIREHGSRFFSNGAKPLAVIEQDPSVKVGEDARKLMRDDFDSMYAGGQNAHKTAFLPGGLTYRAVSISMDDAQWIETRKITAREIFGIYGIPPHKAGDLADATFSNIEHENLDFVISSLMPWLVCWEQAIGRDLLAGDPELYARFNVEGLLRGDFKSRQEGLAIQRRNGVINADEWRAREDMNSRGDAGGAVYIVEGNMQPNDGNEAARQGGANPASGNPT